MVSTFHDLFAPAIITMQVTFNKVTTINILNPYYNFYGAVYLQRLSTHKEIQ